MARSAAQNLTAGGRLANTKRLVLWSVVLVQVCFIACIWLLQSNHNQLQLQSTSNKNRLELDVGRVHFVQQARQAKKSLASSHCQRSENINRYQQDFFQMKIDRMNRSADYAMPAYMDMDLAPTLWCYSEGTLNESRQGRNSVDYLLAQPQCLCASGWHGRDCGQPEIIWRALMTHSRASKRGGNEAPLKLHEASSTSLKRLYYILNLGAWEHINMELLELQLRTLIKVVDIFLIYYYVRDSKDRLKRRTLERQLDAIPIPSYLLYQCEGGQNPGNCSGAATYSYFRHQLWARCGVQMQPTDLLLYGNGGTVYAPAALKYLKYFATDVLPLRFRVKHNVYGFYWQHPQLARLDGVISSLVHLHNAQLDPQRLERQATYTLGDLNHFGGWSCELCMPPEQIVQMLTAKETGNSPHIRMPNETRSSRIDADYIQQLIGAGILLDGHTTLQRLRQQSEKYYAPPTALLYSSQFGQFLVNLYDTNTLDDVQEDED
ncbi:hypothetical protein AWZ03_010940 [Drosophila navojoa]|uniref:Beta-1,4-mannosyl-glycoprotein 4-beta-N-acetylglucosaminyltransferase n=1 Tax=Drosophila navojoa TaxID=7232 RepID=A0A484B1R2_DRONA|nr:uncharacterized protein LOC115563958 [Drosophila navojoa]TDG42644.1 hypothetical protein AWZ03_010940 [Drosophila navojoa]